ncbi:hypothetical protein [Acinetobacter radioresistens]|uniref:hypothetical protein n=1 Tax=Acinetobacter radioresistens TaxID=40216 RepID=UPI000EEB2329|nr:hypothetical protein [Enterococcus faecalis]
MLVNFLDAITEIGKATKQNSNEFTILHYISNGYLDVLIKFDSKYKKQFLQVSQLGADDEYFVLGIEHDDHKIYKVDTDSINLNELLNCFRNIKGNIQVASVKSYPKETFEYVLLDQSYNDDFSGNPIELAEVLNSTNLGLDLNVLELFFDLQQIKNIPSPLRKPNINGIVSHTKKARTIKDIGLWIARKEIKKNPSITKKELGMNIQIYLTKNLEKIKKIKSQLGIKGHITIPNEDTIRKWKELDKVFPKVK